MFGDEILHHVGYPELCFSSYFVLPEGQQIEFSGSEQQFIGSLEPILSENSGGMETDAEFEEFIASSLRSLSSGESANGEEMEVEMQGEDAEKVVSLLADGPSYEHYENDRSDCRLLLILRGQNGQKFKGLAAVLEQHQISHTTPKPLLVKEAKRRMKFLPKGRRFPPSHWNKRQLEKWLSANPIQLGEDEEPFFEMQLKALAESMNLPKSVHE
mmetsp:Transcript_27074/g.62945  ORF Transcript_27074/g.62945 Transcript_27074/m.62945 type:complete len:214 (+) Transcript_27074:398-1039(+)